MAYQDYLLPDRRTAEERAQFEKDLIPDFSNPQSKMVTVTEPITVYSKEGTKSTQLPGSTYDPTIWSPTNPLVTALPTSPIAALGASTAQPDFATSLDQFKETPDQQAKRYALIEEDLARQKREIQATGRASEGGISGQFQKGSRTGTGYDSIKDDQIRLVQKDVAKAIGDAEAAAAQAKMTGDVNAENTALKKLELAQSIKNQADTAALNQARLKLEALTSTFDIMGKIPAGQQVTIGDQTFTGIAQPTPDTQVITDNDGNVSIIDKNTGEVIGQIPGIGEAQAKKLQYNEVNGTLIITDPETGAEVKRMTIPKQYTPGESDTASKKAAITEMNTALSAVKGSDTFVSPDDYLTLRTQWINSEFNPTDFDSEFKGFRNPSNKNYVVSTTVNKTIVGDPSKPIIYSDSTTEVHGS